MPSILSVLLLSITVMNWSGDMILRLTQTLNAQLSGGKLGVHALHANPLLDWSVRAFTLWENEYVLLTNTQSLYSAVLPGVAAGSRGWFAERITDAVRAILAGAGCCSITGDDLAPASVQFAKGLNRSVTGSMNELALLAQILLAKSGMSMPELGVPLNETLLSAAAGVDETYGCPVERFAELIAAQRS